MLSTLRSRAALFLSLIAASAAVEACSGDLETTNTTGPGGHGGHLTGGAGGTTGTTVTTTTTTTSSGGAGGAAPTEWQFKAFVPAPALGSAGTSTEMSAHPADPKTVSFAIAVPTMDVNVAERVGCTTHDLGATAACVTFASVPSALASLGFGYDPAAPGVLIDVLGASGKGLAYRSLNGGMVYDLLPGFAFFSSTPVAARFASGASAFVVRLQDAIHLSTNDGADFQPLDPSTCVPPSSLSSAARSVAVWSAAPTRRVYLCGSGGARRCDGSACQDVVAPAGLTLDVVERSPHEEGLVLMLAHAADQSVVLLRSTDGGATFTAASAPPATASAAFGKITFDPRPSPAAVVASVVTLGGTYLFRSLDGGKTFTDVSPPAALEPPPSAFRTYDFAVAADGAVIALADDGALARLPSSCATSADCEGSLDGQICDPARRACVGCVTSADCPTFWPACLASTHTCGACAVDADCKGSASGPHCGPAGVCSCASDVECAGSSDGAHCDPLFQRCGCASTADCAGAAHPLCQASQSRCVDACSADADCAGNIDGSVCDHAGSGLCVECLDAADCVGHVVGAHCSAEHTCGCTSASDCDSPSLPACDPAKARCVGCLSNADCAQYPIAKVCNLAETGCAECATDADCKSAAKPHCIVPTDNPLAAYCWQ